MLSMFVKSYNDTRPWGKLHRPIRVPSTLGDTIARIKNNSESMVAY